MHRLIINCKPHFWLTGMLLLGIGCRDLTIPERPGPNVVQNTQTLNESFFLHVMSPYKKFLKAQRFNPVTKILTKRYGLKKAQLNRHALLITVDDEIQFQFSESLKNFPAMAQLLSQQRIEVWSWWLLAPQLQQIYDNVIRIPYQHFHSDSFWQAVYYLESLETPYDLILMVHGVPNHLTTSKGYPLLSWKEIQQHKDQLHYLNVVYSQSCFGGSLAPDWIEAGAQTVISYPGFNRNFFYLFHFLDYYRYLKDAYSSYHCTNLFIANFLHRNLLFQTLIALFGFDLSEYLATNTNPQIATKSAVPKVPNTCREKIL